MNLNTVICGDSAHVLKTFPDECIDLTVTSPPYDNLRAYNGYVFDFETIAKQLFRVTKKGGVVVWVVGDATINGGETLTSFKQALFFRECGFNVETMIYEVAGTGAKGSNYYYWQSFEYMFILSNGTPKTSNRIADVRNSDGGRLRRVGQKAEVIKSRTSRRVTAPLWSVRPNIWRYTSAGNDITEHPAQFPEKLVRDHIISWSNEGDTVLDCFAGSGTTLKMAKMLRRKYVGIEISSEYVQLIEKRLCNTSVQESFLMHTNEVTLLRDK